MFLLLILLIHVSLLKNYGGRGGGGGKPLCANPVSAGVYKDLNFFKLLFYSTSKKDLPTHLRLCSRSRYVGPVPPGTGTPQEMAVISLLGYRKVSHFRLHTWIWLLLQLPWIILKVTHWNCNGRGCPGPLLELASCNQGSTWFSLSAQCSITGITIWYTAAGVGWAPLHR